MIFSDIFAFYWWLMLLHKFFALIGLQCVNDCMNSIMDKVDAYLAPGFTAIWDRNLERIATAPMKIISDDYVYPDKNIPIDTQKIGSITQVTPIEAWLTDESIDYSIFFDYYIDAKKAKDALSRLLAKTPIIGGVWVQIDKTSIGVDHSDPKIPFVHATTQYIPSIKDEDYDKPFYYKKYTNGASKAMPFPNGKHVFKVTITHYPKEVDDEKNDNSTKDPSKLFNTLIAIGCCHALCDAEALFTLLRGWSSEIRGVGDKEYKIPQFNRDKLLLKDNELKKLDSNTTILGKHFGHSIMNHGWFVSALWPVRRWQPRSWVFNKKQIDALKQAAFNGKAGDKLREIGRISGNDVLLALYWKLNATLNNGYCFDRHIMCTMVINTRKWIPSRFPDKNINYFGNGLAFLVLSEPRGVLINSDFSEIVLKIRETVMNIKPEDFENDLHFYTNIINVGIKHKHRFQGRWCCNNNNNYWHSHYLHNRDMMVSNLMKLDTHTMDMGNGHPNIVRFNHRDEPTMLTYIFKKTRDAKEYDFYGSFPCEYMKFFDKYDIQNPKLNWNEINKNYVTQPTIRRYLREYPWCRPCKIYPKRDCCSGRKDKKANFGIIEL